MMNLRPPQGANASLGGNEALRIESPPSTLHHQTGLSNHLFAAAGPLGAAGNQEIPETNDRKGSRSRVQRRPVHGVLLLDKPLGLSSNQALQRAKWLLRAEKAGHTGTLDPLATGVLPLCFGAATKFSQIQLEANKTYEATLVLGIKTTTADAEGDVIETRPIPAITPELIARLKAQFTGPLMQIPPMYSALKKDGKALYEYARKGQDVERDARHITIFKLEMAIVHTDTAGVAIKIIANCSKGTYIRTLGEDIGESIGCGAHLGSLRRIESGGFTSAQCVSLQALEAMTEADREALLLSPQSLLGACPVITLDADHSTRFLSGLRRRGATGQWGADAPLAQVFGAMPAFNCSSETPVFLGSAHVEADELIPQRLLSPTEIKDLLQTAQQHAARRLEAAALEPPDAVSFALT